MFGKNYDKDILDLRQDIIEIVKRNNKNNDALIKMIKDNQDLIKGMQDTLLAVANVQKSHKEAIMELSKRH